MITDLKNVYCYILLTKQNQTLLGFLWYKHTGVKKFHLLRLVILFHLFLLFVKNLNWIRVVLLQLRFIFNYHIDSFAIKENFDEA